MLKNILSKENVTFKDFEKIAYKIACEIANQILMHSPTSNLFLFPIIYDIIYNR